MIVLTLAPGGRLDRVVAPSRLEDTDPLPARGRALVSPDRWESAGSAAGVWIGGDRDLEGWLRALPEDRRPPVIALAFPVFGDGRAYSHARRLRRAGFAGDLRAHGDVLMDQVRFMARVGFTSFEMPDTTDVRAVEVALSAYADVYQPAADAVVPLSWRRGADVGWHVASGSGE